MHAPFSGIHVLIARLKRPLDSLVRFLIAHLVHTQAELRDGIAVQCLQVSIKCSASIQMQLAAVTAIPSAEGRGGREEGHTFRRPSREVTGFGEGILISCAVTF